MTNFEFKARAGDLARVRAALQRRGAHFAGVLEQSDTYFVVPHGRLKLREIKRRPATPAAAAGEAQLIFYERGDEAALKRSDYFLAHFMPAEEVREALSRALGVLAVVKKERELFLLGYGTAAAAESEAHIRIHLDRVQGLGEFVEVEAVAGDGVSFAQAESEARALLQEFDILPEHLLAGSYADLLREKMRAESLLGLTL